MSRIAVLMVAAAMLLALAAGLAMAQSEPEGLIPVIDCSGGGKKCKGTNNPDTIQGSANRDIILARAGGDDVDATQGGRDDVHGAAGSDTIDVADGQGNDSVNCGDGDNDVAMFDSGDTITRCEFTEGMNGRLVAIK